MSHRRVAARMDAHAAGLAGLDALRVVMLEALPLDERRDLEAQIEISFWGRALGTAELRDLQHTEFDRLCARLRRHLAEARDCSTASAPARLATPRPRAAARFGRHPGG